MCAPPSQQTISAATLRDRSTLDTVTTAAPHTEVKTKPVLISDELSCEWSKMALVQCSCREFRPSHVGCYEGGPAHG